MSASVAAAKAGGAAPPPPKRPRAAAAAAGAGAAAAKARTLAADLLRSDKVAEEVPDPPLPDEVTAISTFCELTMQRKAAEAAAQERVREAKPQLRGLRAALLRTMRAQEATVLQLPQELRRAADARASAAGLPPVPPYIRLVRNNKDLAITPDIINEVMRGLSAEDIVEAEGEDGVSALLAAVVNGVRRAVRSYTEQIKMTESVPRGTRAADVPLASESLAREAIRLHERGAFVLAAERAKRETVSRVRTAIVAPTAALAVFFERSRDPITKKVKVTSQRVVVEGQDYNVCYREMNSKPKVTFKVLQDVLQEGIADTLSKVLRGGGSGMSKGALATALLAGGKRNELQRLISMKLASLPTVSKIIIHMQRIVPRVAGEEEGAADSDSESDTN